MYGEGISRLGEMLDLGVKLDLVQKSGSWFNMGDIRLGPGPGRRQAVFPGSPRRGRQAGGRHPPGLPQADEQPVKIAAKAAGRAVDVSADDFDDED